MDEYVCDQMLEALHQFNTQDTPTQTNTRWQPDGTYNKKPLDPNYFNKYYRQQLKTPFTCPDCGRTIGSKSNYSKHRDTNICKRNRQGWRTFENLFNSIWCYWKHVTGLVLLVLEDVPFSFALEFWDSFWRTNLGIEDAEPFLVAFPIRPWNTLYRNDLFDTLKCLDITTFSFFINSSLPLHRKFSNNSILQFSMPNSSNNKNNVVNVRFCLW